MLVRVCIYVYTCVCCVLCVYVCVLCECDSPYVCARVPYAHSVASMREQQHKRTLAPEECSIFIRAQARLSTELTPLAHDEPIADEAD